MYKEFKNESWEASSEKDFYVRTLKSIRFHRPLERLDAPTTNLLFVSRLTDPSIRQYFEDSSRHFKTYNLYTDLSDFFKVRDGAVGEFSSSKFPNWFFNILELKPFFFLLKRFFSPQFKDHFAYRKRLRGLSLDDLAREVGAIFQMIGLKHFSRLNVIIGANDDKNVHYGIKFLCKLLNNPQVKSLLAEKYVLIPDDHQTAYGIFSRKKSQLKFVFVSDILDVNSSLLEYLKKKTEWVMERKRVKDLLDKESKNTNNKDAERTLIIGRRILTRGQDILNSNSLIQSYDYKHDADLKIIQRILVRFLRSFNEANATALIIIENYPNQISYLVSRDEHLKELLHGSSIALACVEPETKDIYTFEGDQFIQKSLKQIY